VFLTAHSDDPDRVVGYYALAAAQIEAADALPRLLKGQPSERAVPVVLLARLAVDRAHQHQRVGRSLLRDAMLRVVQASEPIGIRALLVHAKHEQARAWYTQYGFEPSSTDPLHLLLLLKDIRKVLGGDR
jgi:GNAT superfamily N-acetyltransferase